MHAGVCLGVDYGTATTKAVVSTVDGRRILVHPDGVPVMPSGVWVDPDGGGVRPGAAGLAAAAHRPDCYLTDLPNRITEGTIAVGGRPVDVLDLVAASLRHLAGEAAQAAGHPATAVTISVPPGWGPRRRALLREAAARAGLPQPLLVAAPVAVAAHLAAATANPPADGAYLLVADAGASALTVTVVQHTSTGVQVLAARTVPASGGHDIDTALAHHAAATVAAADPGWWDRLQEPSTLDDSQAGVALRHAARQAKEHLAYQARTVLPLPDPHLPAVVDRDLLAELTAPLRHDLATAVDELLAAADIDRSLLAAVVLTGGGAHLPGLSDTLTEATGRPPVTPARPDLAAAYGTLDLTYAAPAATDAADDKTVPGPRVRLRVPDLVGPGLLAVASITLVWQALTTAHTVTIGGGIQIKEAVLPNEQLAAAALLATLAAAVIAHLIPTAILHGNSHPDPRQAADAHRLTRQSYLAAALAAMAAATLYGLAAGAYFGLSTNPWLPWTVWWTLPAASSLAATGLLTTRLPTHTLPGWIHHTRPPLTAALAAAGGILLMRLSLAVTVPNTIHGLVHLSGNLGAAILAAATITTLTRNRLLRLVGAVLLAAGYATVFSPATSRFLTITYLCALTWWTLTLTIRTARAAYPDTIAGLRRLVDTR